MNTMKLSRNSLAIAFSAMAAFGQTAAPPAPRPLQPGNVHGIGE
jgi:hypothetical protein